MSSFQGGTPLLAQVHRAPVLCFERAHTVLLTPERIFAEGNTIPSSCRDQPNSRSCPFPRRSTGQHSTAVHTPIFIPNHVVFSSPPPLLHVGLINRKEGAVCLYPGSPNLLSWPASDCCPFASSIVRWYWSSTPYCCVSLNHAHHYLSRLSPPSNRYR